MTTATMSLDDQINQLEIELGYPVEQRGKAAATPERLEFLQGKLSRPKLDPTSAMADYSDPRAVTSGSSR